eukprot:6199970-Prorocentrum_lima.AAC.1
MTSSLVGSEMCIRDSFWGALPDTYAHKHMYWALEVPIHGCLGGWLAGRAVSYTHLTLPTICSV